MKLHESPSVPNRPDPDNLWAPRTLAFFGAVVAANLLLDVAVLGVLVWADSETWAVAQSNSIWPALLTYAIPVTSALLVGSLFSQTVILGLWTALFPGKTTTRWLAGTLVLMAAAIALAVPMKMQFALSGYLSTGMLEVDLWTICAQALEAAPVWLMLFYFAQIPFWIARRWAGMRVTRDPLLQPKPERSLRLLDMFGILAFVGIAIAAGRIAAPEVNVLVFVLSMTIVTGAMWLMGISLLVVVMSRRRRLVRFVFVAGICELFALGTSTIYFQFENRIPWAIVLCIFHAAALAIAFAALANGAAGRAYGYRLIWAWPRRKTVALAELAATSSPAAASPRP